MDKLFGLPAHPLIVHMPVVLLSLALVGVILCLIRPGWRQALIVPTAAIAVASAGGAILATKSGEWLRGQMPGVAIDNHAQFGEMARNLAILFAMATCAWAVRELLLARGWLGGNPLAKILGRGWVGILASWGSLVIGLGMVFFVVEAGHTGAKAVWEKRMQPDSSGSAVRVAPAPTGNP